MYETNLQLSTFVGYTRIKATMTFEYIKCINYVKFNLSTVISEPRAFCIPTHNIYYPDQSILYSMKAGNKSKQLQTRDSQIRWKLMSHGLGNGFFTYSHFIASSYTFWPFSQVLIFCLVEHERRIHIISEWNRPIVKIGCRFRIRLFFFRSFFD